MGRMVPWAKSGFWAGSPQQKEYKEKGVINSGCFRYMIGNKCYLTDYEDYDGGFVSFGDGKGRISRKAKINSVTLDFDDVYFCKELKYNLFSMSQMCDIKNNVLFTDTECLVLFSNFKLLDESQVLLRVPRKDNIYSVDLKSVVPTGGLTCLFVKAITNESNLWHKRLRHINYKTMNKLVRGNHNGVPKRENKTLIEAARTMLVDFKLPTTFWAKAVNTACYVINRALVIKPHNKTPYELIHGRPPLIDFMKPFGCLVTILNTKDYLGKFDKNADEGFFVGYSVVSKAIRVFNKRTRIVEETLNIRFLKNSPNVKGNGPDWLFDIDSLTISINYVPVVARFQTNGIAGTKYNIVAHQAKKKKEPKQEYIMISICTTDLLISQDPKDSALDARKKATKVDTSQVSDNGGHDDQITRSEFGSTDGPSSINAASPSPINAAGTPTTMEEEVDMNNVDSSNIILDAPLTKFFKDHPKDQAIGTKWVFTNKKDERGIVIKNKAILVAQGHTQVEGINCDEEFAPVARIEAIRLCLAYASFKDFVVYQMDVKSAFLYETIEKEVYVYQPPGFEYPDFPDKVYKVEKALYGLHQAPRAWFQGTPKSLHLYPVKRIFRYLKGQPKLGLWYPRNSPFDLETYSDSDYAGASLDRKSTIGCCQFLGKRLISWQRKKQNIVANSTTKAEYVAAVSCCRQMLWIQNHMLEYGFNLMNTKIYIDNENETIYKEWEDRMEKAATIASSLKAEHDKAQTRFEAASKQFNDPPLSREKPSESEGFKQIVDLLNAKPIRDALTVNPTVYASCVKQFWTTAKINKLKEWLNLISSYTKKIFANMRRQGQGYSRNVTPLFETMMVNAQEEVGEENIKPKRKQRQTAKNHSPSSEKPIKESIITPSNDPLPSAEDSIQLNELMIFCTNLQQQVLNLEEVKIAQAKEIAKLKKRVKKQEKRKKSRTTGMRRLKKVGSSKQAESSEEKDSLGAQADASKQERSIEDIDQDAEIALVDKAQERMHDANMFGVDDLEGNEVFVDVREKTVSTVDPVTTADIPTVSSSKDKGKAKMIEPEKPLINKDQITLDKEVARKLEAEMRAEIEEEERIAREKDEANRAVIEEYDDVQAIIDADRQLAEQIQAQEREQLSIKERCKLLAELIESSRKYFAAKRAEEIRNKSLVAEQTKVRKRKEKVVVSSESEGTTSSANKKQEYVKSDDKKKEKKVDEKKRDMNKVKCYNCTKEGHFAKDCKKAKVKDYEYYKTKMLLAKKGKDKKVLLAEDHDWMESSSDSDQEINANMVFMALMEKVKNNELNELFKVLIENNNDLLAQTKALKEQLKVKHVVIDNHVECQAKYAKLEAERYEYMIRYSAYFDNDKQHRKQIIDQEILFDKMSRQLVELDENVRMLKNTVLEKDLKISGSVECVCNKDLEIEKCLERLNDCENKLHKIGQTNQTIHMIMPSKDKMYSGYTSRFLIHSNEALEIEKFKRARENKIKFAYDCRSLNASYVNEKIKFSDDYFQEIINPYFKKIDFLFQQTSSLKPYVPIVILENIIIDLEDEVIIKICLWIIDLGCSKHITGNRALLTNFVEKLLETVRFGNNDFAVIAGYRDSISNDMIPNVDEATPSHNVFNERLEDAYFDASTSFHDTSDVRTYYQPYPYETKWTKDHRLHKIIVARIEAIRLFLAYAAHKDFTVFQMDVTIIFLNGILKEEMYVAHPPGFVSKQYPDHVYALDKAVHGLKQAPRATRTDLPWSRPSNLGKLGLEQASVKKQKPAEQEQAKVADDDIAELKRCLKIVPEDDDVAIKATPISSKSPTI
nr:retrovirus-related Pol polyprotein from transposon TNT 1-94 [Tanacetum cinerariifolium]